MSSGSSLIKDLKNGNSFCQLCSMQFKTKTLTAHINGRKHREALSQLRQKDNQLKRAKDATASEVRGSDEETGLKRKHANEFAASVEHEKVEKKAKRADDVVLDGRTTVPWQAEVRENEKEGSGRSTGTNLIEGLPKGFFDDEQMDSRVRETIEKQKQISSEVDRFYKEVEELETQREEELEQMNEQSAIHSDIEKIDEQIERWKLVNELEKKKETLVESVASKFEQKPNFDKVIGTSDDDDDDDVDIVNFDTISWRTKAF